MNAILEEIKISILATLLTALILCGLYPLAVWGTGQLLFPWQANGSLIVTKDKVIVGTSLLGQGFTSDKYFQPRPSAAGNAGYDATSSGGSNLGPTAKAFLDGVKHRVEDYRKQNSLPETTPVPADAVTASASGLDPHISIENAKIQAPRVANARNLPLETVLTAVKKYTDGPDWGIFGVAGVNVLKLNLALDGRLE